MLQLIDLIKAYFLPELEDRGASAVEYAIVVALISTVVVVVATTMGNQILAMFQQACTRLGATGC